MAKAISSNPFYRWRAVLYARNGRYNWQAVELSTMKSLPSGLEVTRAHLVGRALLIKEIGEVHLIRAVLSAHDGCERTLDFKVSEPFPIVLDCDASSTEIASEGVLFRKYTLIRCQDTPPKTHHD